MDNSLIPADEDHGVWDELNHQQSREIQQHLNQNSRTGSFLHQTVVSIRAAAERAAISFQYKPVVSESLADFGLPNHHEEPLMQEFDVSGGGYEEFPQSAPPARGGFVFLEQFRLPRRQEDAWGAVSNLDLFFSSLYNYYYHRGLTPILGKGIADLVSLFVTLWLSVILFAFVDWKELARCTDENSCKPNFGDYMIRSPFSHFSLWNSIVILYCLLFTAYGIFSVWSFWRTIQEAFKVKQFFEDRLGISVRQLEAGAVDWDKDIVCKLAELNDSGDYRIAIHGQGTLDALMVAQRILRKENFLIAFFNRGLLDLQVPFLSQQSYFCKSLEWAIYFCVLNYMYNHKFQIRPAFYLDPVALQRRFILCGIAHAIFLPFLAFFMTLHFLMQNVYDWKSTKQYMGPKEWSLTAKWTFREFNELPHFFERRLGPSYEACEEYFKLFKQSELMTTLGRILAFIGGSFGVILLVFAAVNDAILLHVKIGNFNLLWFVGVTTLIYSAGKSMLPDPKVHARFTRNLVEDKHLALSNLATHTHHYPENWKVGGFDNKTMSTVKGMFTNKANIFLNEIISLVLAPIILCYSLPRSAEHICEFVMAAKAEVPGVGDLCGYSTFNFDQFNDYNFEGKMMGGGERRGEVAASVAELNDVEAASSRHPTPKAHHGKMEKSFFGFKVSHPKWICTKSGQTLLDRVAQFKEAETRILALEQQQHIDAASRQLETLARLEQRRQMVSPVMAQLRESYIGGGQVPQPAGADSGGGGPASPVVTSSTAPQVPPIELNVPSPPPLTPLRPSPRNRETTPPPFATHDQNVAVGPASSPRAPAVRSQADAVNQGLSVLHYADMGLSTELTRMLNRSTLDPDMSATASMLGAYGPPLQSAGPSLEHLSALAETDPEEEQRRAEHAQYMLLQRYHAHLTEAQRRSNISNTQSVHGGDNVGNTGGAVDAGLHQSAML